MPNNHQAGCQGNPLRTHAHIVLCACTAMQLEGLLRSAFCTAMQQVSKHITESVQPITSPRCKPVQSYDLPSSQPPQVWPDAMLPHSSPSTTDPVLHPHSHTHAARSTCILCQCCNTSLVCCALCPRSKWVHQTPHDAASAMPK